VSIRDQIRDGLRRGAVRTAGSVLRATITRTTGADESTYPPTPGTEREYTAEVLFSNYSASDRSGTEITARDTRLLVSAPMTTPDGETAEPSNGDTITVGGRKYHAVSVDSIQPGGLALMWEIQARSADG
jgi:hypothetical protein